MSGTLNLFFGTKDIIYNQHSYDAITNHFGYTMLVFSNMSEHAYYFVYFQSDIMKNSVRLIT